MLSVAVAAAAVSVVAGVGDWCLLLVVVGDCCWLLLVVVGSCW